MAHHNNFFIYATMISSLAHLEVPSWSCKHSKNSLSVEAPSWNLLGKLTNYCPSPDPSPRVPLSNGDENTAWKHFQYHAQENWCNATKTKRQTASEFTNILLTRAMSKPT